MCEFESLMGLQSVHCINLEVGQGYEQANMHQLSKAHTDKEAHAKHAMWHGFLTSSHLVAS